MGVRVGVFGKIAGLGDFIRRDLPAGFEAMWDGWLQRGIQASRTALGQGWEEVYRHAPIWRFALAGGLAGPGARVGVLMPSQDRVGRLFPLTLVAEVEPGRAAAAMADDTALAAMEEAALDTLDLERGRAPLDAALDRLAGPSGAPGPTLSGSLWRVAGATGGAIGFPGLPPAERFVELLDPSRIAEIGA